jgi:ATP-dependent DNA helicase RecQ
MYTISIKTEANAIFQTILLLEERYGAKYVVQILRGESNKLKSLNHKLLETFGLMAKTTEEKLQNIVFYLLKKQYLQINNPEYGTLCVSEKGKLLLVSDTELEVEKSEITISTENRILMSLLKEMRKNCASALDCFPFMIFTDYTLQQIAEKKPQNIGELEEIPNVHAFFLQKYSEQLFIATTSIKQLAEEQIRKDKEKRVKQAAYQSVKSLFLSGESLVKIAEKRQIKENTVLTYLSDLYEMGEINIKPWIEKNIAPKALHKGVTFFEQTKQEDMKLAYEVLGLDYNTLKMCKLYIMNVNHLQEEIAIAS